MWNELHVAVEAPAKASSPDTTTGAGNAEALRQTALHEVCVWDPDCKPTHFRKGFFNQGVFSLADKIEQDAKLLREKACHTILIPLATKGVGYRLIKPSVYQTTTLTGLLNDKAGAENAIKSYELSRNLTVFTWLTVIFVSIVSSLITCLRSSYTVVDSD